MRTWNSADDRRSGRIRSPTAKIEPNGIIADHRLLLMSPLCRGCGMAVITNADGSCPSCGSTGPIISRSWRGKRVGVLVPKKEHAPLYACLYLRPYAVKFLAAA